MTRQPFVLLKPWEVSAFIAGRKTMIARPVMVPWKGGRLVPPYEPYYGEDGQGHLVEHIDEVRVAGVDWAPWWPGDVLAGKECWSPRARIAEPFHLPADYPDEGLGAWYWADGNPDYGDWEKPRSSACMPPWAVRIHLRVEAVTAKRVREITDSEARMLGAAPADEGPVGCDRCGFLAQWDADYPRFPWASDPWIWLAMAPPVVD